MRISLMSMKPWVFMMVLLVPAVTGAQVDESTRWADPSRVRLDVEFPGQGYQASWELFRCACGDLLVRSELNAPGEVDRGESLLVEGRAVLSRGFGEEQAELGASLDAPALMMQLALRLLERAEPGGPSRVAAPLDVDVTDEINPILLESYSAIGGFQAPWSVRGRIEPMDAGRWRFDLGFRFSAEVEGTPQEAAMRLKGQAEFVAGEFPVAGAEALAGWQLSWRDEQDPARAGAAGAATLDELRSLIRARPL